MREAMHVCGQGINGISLHLPQFSVNLKLFLYNNLNLKQANTHWRPEVTEQITDPKSKKSDSRERGHTNMC